MEINQSVPNEPDKQVPQEPQQNNHNQPGNPTTQNNSQPVSGDNLSPQDDPIDEEKGQIEEQQNPNQTQEDPKPTQPHDFINKDTYISKLQTYVNKIKMDLSLKWKEYDELNDDNKKTKQALKKIRFDFLSSKQQISALTQQKSDLQKEVESLKQQNEQLNNQITVFKEAGDVSLFKEKICELEKLLEIQKKQLQIKSTMIDEKEQNLTQKSQIGNKIEVFNLIEKYETKKKELQNQLQSIQMRNQALQKQLEQALLQNQVLKETNSSQEVSLANYGAKITQLEDKLAQKEEQFTRRLKQSEESLMQMVQNQQIHQNLQPEIQRKPSVINPQQKYGIKMLTPHEERDIILRQFIELQVKYLSITEQLSSLRERHYHTLRQIKNYSTTHISKKDYSELYKKYIKLRKCLENSLLTEQSLRNQLKNYTQSNNQILGYNIFESQQQITTNLESRYRSMILQEPQNAINQVQKIIQKSSETQQQLFTLKQQLQTRQKLIKTQKILREKQQRIINLEKQIQAKTNLTQLYDNELTFKNNQIQLLRTSHQQNLNKIYELQNNNMQKSQQNRLMSLIQQSKINIQILEIKNIQAIKENTTLKNQKHMLTQLYNNVKAMYEELLQKQPRNQKVGHSNLNEQKQQSSLIVHQPQPCKECKQREEKQKQIHFSQSQVQTEGIPELYFKQIKGLLTVMKKFPLKVQDILTKLDTEKATIHQAKKKFEQATETYAAKYRQLDEQKKANEQWRQKQKEEIREEFQQIRDLLISERLMTALKKAKSLIEYYEENAPEQNAPEQQEDGNPEEIQEQGNEKNEGEEPIEQEKENP